MRLSIDANQGWQRRSVWRRSARAAVLAGSFVFYATSTRNDCMKRDRDNRTQRGAGVRRLLASALTGTLAN
jgi:hypothetical protein